MTSLDIVGQLGKLIVVRIALEVDPILFVYILRLVLFLSKTAIFMFRSEAKAAYL